MNKENRNSNNENENYRREQIALELIELKVLEEAREKALREYPAARARAQVRDDRSSEGAGDWTAEVELNHSDAIDAFDSAINESKSKIKEWQDSFLADYGKAWNA